VSDDNVQRIDEFLSDEWIETWSADVVAEVEAYLRKHAAFDAFLEGDDSLAVD
jgi:hypothetical protein